LVDQDYDISQEDVRELVETKLASGEVDKTLVDGYFKVLYKRTITYIKEQSFVDEKNREAALERADGTMYPIVLEVINKMADVQPNANDSVEVKRAKALRRNERSNYARSAKSAILKAIKAGLVIEDKRPDMVGKSALEKEATQCMMLQRSTLELARGCANKLVILMRTLKGEDATNHALLAQWIINNTW
jgi:hypothetical protein